ncbi:MAG: zinc-finger domain-containing protein [Pseudomonadota bacterium]
MEVVFTATRRVSCDGGGPLGHPKVFYTIDNSGYAECMYCDRIYLFDPSRAGQVLEGGSRLTPATENS